jgi:hypothetical protein
MTSQASSRLKRKSLSLLSIGTACSIFLQSSLCYSFAWAKSPEANQPLAQSGGKIDEATLLVMRGTNSGLPPIDLDIQPPSAANNDETTIDSAALGPDNTAMVPGSPTEPTQEVERIIDQCNASTPSLRSRKDTVALIGGDPKQYIVDQATSAEPDMTVSPDGRLVAASGTTLSGSVSIDEVESLTKQIAGKIFELERMNTYFRIESTHVSRWRKWRTFAGDEAAAQTVAAGVLVFIIYALRGVHRGATRTVIKFHNLQIPGKFYKQPPNTRLEGGFITTIPGIWVGVAQEMYELGENYYNDWKCKQRGFDPKTTRAKATQIQGEIDKMLAERANLVNSGNVSSQERELQLAEGKVLKDMRDLALHEYIDYYARAKRVRTFENTFYTVDIAERVTGFVSLLMGLIALHIGTAGRNRLGVLGIMQEISAVLAPAAPITGRIVSTKVWKAAHRSIEKDIHGIDVNSAEAFDTDRKHLEDLVLNSSGSGSPVLASISNREPIYRLEKDNFSAIQDLRHREWHDAKSAFWQSVFIRTVAFGNKTAFASVAMAGGWTHLNNPRHFDQLLLGATTPYYVTLQMSGADVIRRNVSGQMLERRDRAKGYLPRQIYKTRLDRLDKMEAFTNPTKRISLK